MNSKAQSGLRKLSTSRKSADSIPTPFSLTSQKSFEAMIASSEVLEGVDPGWFFGSAPDAMVLVDAQGRIAVVNAQAERLFGYWRDELVGEPVDKLMPAHLRQGHIKHLSEYNGAPRTRPMGTNLELYGLRKDGSEFPIEISVSPLEPIRRF